MSLSRVYSRRTLSWQTAGTLTHLFTAAVFTIAGKWISQKKG